MDSQIPSRPSLQLGHPERCGAAEIQEERALLLGKEGGGDDVIEASRDVLQLQVTETTPARDGHVSNRRARKRDCSVDVDPKR